MELKLSPFNCESLYRTRLSTIFFSAVTLSLVALNQGTNPYFQDWYFPFKDLQGFILSIRIISVSHSILLANTSLQVRLSFLIFVNGLPGIFINIVAAPVPARRLSRYKCLQLSLKTWVDPWDPRGGSRETTSTNYFLTSLCVLCCVYAPLYPVKTIVFHQTLLLPVCLCCWDTK